MFHFSYTGLRLVHDEMVLNAMKRAHIDAELIHSSRRTVYPSLLKNFLKRIHSRLNIFNRIEQLRHWPRAFAKEDRCDSL
jgi:hypothetical protein